MEAAAAAPRPLPPPAACARPRARPRLRRLRARRVRRCPAARAGPLPPTAAAAAAGGGAGAASGPFLRVCLIWGGAPRTRARTHVTAPDNRARGRALRRGTAASSARAPAARPAHHRLRDRTPSAAAPPAPGARLSRAVVESAPLRARVLRARRTNRPRARHAAASCTGAPWRACARHRRRPPRRRRRRAPPTRRPRPPALADPACVGRRRARCGAWLVRAAAAAGARAGAGAAPQSDVAVARRRGCLPGAPR